MATKEPAPHTFPTRLRKPGLHARLQRTAKMLGTSMNDIVEGAIEHELSYIANDFEVQLERTLAEIRLIRLTDDNLDGDIEAFGEAEASYEPIRARLIDSDDDPFDIGSTFASTVE